MPLHRFILLLLLLTSGAAAAAAAPVPPPGVSFELDVQPILTALGCNAGACHGKARGQNGFALSLLAYDPDFDHNALAKDSRGRRLFPASPSNSLLLLKATAQLPHGGGQRMTVDDPEYKTLRDWIAAGAPRRIENEPAIARIDVAPRQRSMSPNETQHLKVTAHYSDGSIRDVTRLAAYQSSEAPVAGVDKTGLVKVGTIPGEAVVMARYMHRLDTFTATAPQTGGPGEVPDEVYAKLPRSNFIDDLVWAKLKALKIVPSGGIDDAKFLRRAYLDIIGRLPSIAEAQAFLNSPPSQGGVGGGSDSPPTETGAAAKDQPQQRGHKDSVDATLPPPLPKREGSKSKREALVDDLLNRPEYGDFWANKWADLLRPNPYRVGIKAVFNYDGWIRQSFRENKPYDQFVRELVTAKGSSWDHGATVLFRDRRSPDEITTLVSQLFLGIRLECAKCHQHPFEKWSQEDFYSFAAYFAKVKHKGEGVSPPISGGEEVVYIGDKGEVRHPITNKVLEPRPLFSVPPPSKGGAGGGIKDRQASTEIVSASPTGNPPPNVPLQGGGTGDDPREALAAWMTSKENDFFAMVAANRVWADLMGRPLVDPVDDLRITNPPTNEPLLRALGAYYREQKFDQKKLIRAIVLSQVYALSSIPEPGGRNVKDTRYHSRHYRTRLRAEVVLDAASDITQVREDFSAMPPGSRSMQIWTTRINSLTLDTFGRPDPNQDPPCERQENPTVTQALHLMLSPQLHGKVTSDAGWASKLAASKMTPGEIVEQLYLAVYSRFPTEREKRFATGMYEEKGAIWRIVTEDLLWSMLNTAEFLFGD